AARVGLDDLADVRWWRNPRFESEAGKTLADLRLGQGLGHARADALDRRLGRAPGPEERDPGPQLEAGRATRLRHRRYVRVAGEALRAGIGQKLDLLRADHGPGRRGRAEGPVDVAGGHRGVN